MKLHLSTDTVLDQSTSSPMFDAWLSAHPGELGLMRRALKEWLTRECALDRNVAAEMVIAVHETAPDSITRLTNPTNLDGVALRGDFDDDELVVTLVMPADLRDPVLHDVDGTSTQLVLQLVDEADVEVRDLAARVSLRRQMRAPGHGQERGTHDAPDDGRPAPPAGWFPDPARRAELRYWDGRWTAHVQTDGRLSLSPPRQDYTPPTGDDVKDR